MKEIIEYIEKRMPLSEEMKRDLKNISIVKNVEKGEILLAENSLRKIQIFVVNFSVECYLK